MPRRTFHYFDAHLTVPIAVLDAPMILVDASTAQPSSRLVPWVRVTRHEYDNETDDWRKDRQWAIDVVHVDYLETYIEQHLLPFAEAFGKLVVAHDEELATGEGFASGLGAGSHEGLEAKLRPRPALQLATRGKGIAIRLLSMPYLLYKSLTRR